jgi:hypothetical protein
MKSSGLAVTVLTLLVTLVALDLSGAHQVPAQPPPLPRVSIVHLNDALSEDSVRKRLVSSVMESQASTTAPFMNHGRVVHRCVTVHASGTAGAPGILPGRSCRADRLQLIGRAKAGHALIAA